MAVPACRGEANSIMSKSHYKSQGGGKHPARGGGGRMQELCILWIHTYMYM